MSANMYISRKCSDGYMGVFTGIRVFIHNYYIDYTAYMRTQGNSSQTEEHSGPTARPYPEDSELQQW